MIGTKEQPFSDFESLGYLAMMYFTLGHVFWSGVSRRPGNFRIISGNSEIEKNWQPSRDEHALTKPTTLVEGLPA